MKNNIIVSEAIKKVRGGDELGREAVVNLLRIPFDSPDAYKVVSEADKISREACGNKSEIYAQIGFNLSPCPNNCAFCSFAENNKIFTENRELDPEAILALSLKSEKDGANAVFFMITANYSFEKFLEISKEIRKRLKRDTIMVANTGDFGQSEAKKLKDAGYAAIYHAIRLGEGRFTGINPETRIRTIQAARDAGLLIGTCVEPIGPEHTVEEIAEKILIGRGIKPCYSGAMRRVSIPGSTLEKYGMISEPQLAYIVAVTRLAMGRDLAGNCTHEPNLKGAVSGANLFWAEAGSNPRDTELETTNGRGMDIRVCSEIFRKAGYEILSGPSSVHSGQEHRSDAGIRPATELAPYKRGYLSAL
jgi:biotin synthase